jgi:hypothetical protein
VPRLGEREAGLAPPYPGPPGGVGVRGVAVAADLRGERQQVIVPLGRAAAVKQPVGDAAGQVQLASSNLTPASSILASISAGSAYTR